MKRCRIEENRYDNVWARLVARLLFVLIRITELAISLMGQRIYMGTMEETDVEGTDMEETVGTSSTPRTEQGLQPVAKDDLQEQPGDSGITLHHPGESNSTVCLRREEPHQLPTFDTIPKHSAGTHRTPRTATARINRTRKSATRPPNGAPMPSSQWRSV